ncbi:hypothetical protein AVEN_261352-1 [Araneus ventricosus]|uniref:Uncharacterized protein n=1 Tax=Araneus ventricosus TaxID=182803 RepID=A0A4Y2VGJ1_ARAVE|nr:hypothetical protein AVEN_261352-1 [Araneus ventricosus]
MYHPFNGLPRTANRWGNLLSMRRKKQTELQQLLMESSLAYPRQKDGKRKIEEEKKMERDRTLGYLGVVIPVTQEEDVPLRGQFVRVSE